MQDKVLLLLADGMRPDYMIDCGNPYTGEFLGKSKYTLNAKTVMPSVTLPCHMSLFHSVAPERHGIITNTWVPQVRPVSGICEVLKANNKTSAMLYNWEPLKDITRPGSLSYSFFLSDGYFGDKSEQSLVKVTERITENTLRLLEDDLLDFVFVYYGLPDTVGHALGFTGEEYRQSLCIIWDNIKRIHEALPREFGMVITSDHGGHGRSHGTDIPEDMTIPIIFRGSMFDDVSAAKLDAASIIDIAPTVVKALGIAPDSDWEGNAL